MKLVVALGFASLAACAADTDGRYSQALSAPPPGECGAVETHVIGIFQTPHGDANLFIDRPGKHVLVLSAHEQTTWHIKTAPDAELVHVYAVGFHNQIVDLTDAHGKPTVRIDSSDKNSVAACGYSWPYDGQGCDTDELLHLASLRMNHDVNSFAGCYQASTWKIGKDMAATSNCAVGQGFTQDHFFSCDASDTDGQCGGGSGSGGSGSGSDGSGSDGGYGETSGPIFY